MLHSGERGFSFTFPTWSYIADVKPDIPRLGVDWGGYVRVAALWLQSGSSSEM